MSAVPKFPWPLSDTTPDPNAELRPRFECERFPRAQGGGGDGDTATQDALPEEPTRIVRRSEQLESVGRLAGGVAHDFNNLLTGVLLYCDLILAADPDERVRRYAIEIRNAGMQATGLVRQLLAVAKPANSDPRLLSLNEIAEGLRNLLARLIGENIELRFRLSPRLGLVHMDPTQAQQILLNLVLNARDAMPGGGQITVETSNCRMQIVSETAGAHKTARNESSEVASSQGSRVASLPCVLFVVEDNGAGMDAATQAHLFEAFFTTKPTGKGTGLGLATVHDIVTRNGGIIHVESALARGTRITVLLPLVPQPEQNPQPIREPQKIEGEFPAAEAIRKGITP
jgi:two-component system, cell cycle sensor histidine kinase and response regulator CckA